MSELSIPASSLQFGSNAAELVIARKSLAEADTLAKVTKCIDGGEAMRVLARKIGLSKDAQNDWAEYKLDAERKAGQMLAEMPRHPGGKPTSPNTMLGEMGISWMQSSRWRRIWSVPPTIYDEWKINQRAKGVGELTEAAALALAKHLQREADKKRRASDIADIIQSDSAPPSIMLADWRDWLPQQPECDLLLTDPPYSTDVEDIDQFVADWLPVALDKVLPTGRAYVCIGAYPDELRAYLNTPTPEHLILANILVWTYRNTLGPSPKFDYKQNWQAILYYRGVDAAPLNCPEMLEQFSVQNINAPDGRLGDRWHTWQKPDMLAERFVRHATEPDDLVLDPFACTGTFLLAAARLGRQAHGCEISEENLAIALERGCRRA